MHRLDELPPACTLVEAQLDGASSRLSDAKCALQSTKDMTKEVGASASTRRKVDTGSAMADQLDAPETSLCSERKADV